VTGARESFTTGSLPPGTYDVALKARDECGNQSGLSNVVEVELQGAARP